MTGILGRLLSIFRPSSSTPPAATTPPAPQPPVTPTQPGSESERDD